MFVCLSVRIRELSFSRSHVHRLAFSVNAARVSTNGQQTKKRKASIPDKTTVALKLQNLSLWKSSEAKQNVKLSSFKFITLPVECLLLFSPNKIGSFRDIKNSRRSSFELSFVVVVEQMLHSSKQMLADETFLSAGTCLFCLHTLLAFCRLFSSAFRVCIISTHAQCKNATSATNRNEKRKTKHETRISVFPKTQIVNSKFKFKKLTYNNWHYQYNIFSCYCYYQERKERKRKTFKLQQTKTPNIYIVKLSYDLRTDIYKIVIKSWRNSLYFKEDRIDIFARTKH